MAGITEKMYGNQGGGSGGDSHNKGHFATPEDLRTAYPTAEAGDYATVESTDTIWLWDSGTSAWVDGHKTDAVTSVNGQTGDVVIPNELPSQTGQSGKFLTTDGADASWSDKPLVNKATGANGIGIGGSSLVASGNNSIAMGPNPQATAPGAIAIGVDARATVADGIAIGDYARSSANKAYQIGSGTNGTANSFQVGSHQLLNLSDGTIPEARLADTTNAQQGDVLTLDANGDAVWQAGGGGSGLPDQTGQSGKFLTTDGTDASWSDTVSAINLSQTLSVSADTKLVVFKNGSTEVGYISATINGPRITSGNPNNWGVRFVGNLVPEGSYNLGWSAFGVVHKWNKIYVDKISSGDNNISVPNTTGTMAVIQVNTTITLAAADWSSNTQTVNVTGMTADGVVMVSPDPTDQSAYTSAGILCTAQAAGTLTFTCDTVPSGDLSVNVVML